MNILEKLGLNEIRERYLSFFESKGHLRLPSFSLVPKNDASLLLINAGMAPLKPYFTGKETPPRKRVTTCQKCIRTPDIERVGKTARHGTFFEMLGNFSFGDYFKNEATSWAWEFVTKEMKMPVDKLWVTIYEDDDEAEAIWRDKVGVAPDRIVRMGKEDNFWEIGTGPCGPCSEIYFDRGAEKGCGKPDCKVGCDCDRYVEFWNLVFTQFDKDEDGNYNRLEHPNIDTGMGMERLAAIMQDVDNLFEVDTVRNIMLHVCKIAGIDYHSDEKSDVALRVITDHIRGGTFMISDGILPSNEGRGYVLRRILRRAARYGKLIGINEPFLYKVVDTVVQENGGAYPELREKLDFIKKVVKNEEESFDKTVDQGLAILNEYIAEHKKNGEDTLSGENAFKLNDTYGFPIDLTMEIVEENGMKVDREGFEKLLDEQKERSRNARKEGEGAGWDDDIFARLDVPKTEFIGYDNYECDAKVIAIVKDNEPVDSVSDGEAVLILDKTVFYGEGGGQVGDKGIMNGATIEVFDTKKTADGKYLHKCNIISDTVKVGDTVKCKIDVDYRKSIMRNHSATHLLQKALREVLGTHVEQSGSLVTAEKLRFDFTHFSAVTPEELKDVEDKVNDAILRAMEVDISEKSIDEAKAMGAMALFGEKYGDVVRVVKMGDYSTELCGGCHVGNTSHVGLFKILSEGGVASGIRRIEAVTGTSVLEMLRNAENEIAVICDILKTTPSAVVSKAEGYVETVKGLQKEIEGLKSKLAGGSIDDIIKNAVEISGTKLIAARLDEFDMAGLMTVSDKIKDKVSDGVAVLATAKDGKINFVVMATKDAVAKGANAGAIIKQVAQIAGGNGGGKPDMAKAGGKDISKVDEAVKAAEEIVKSMIK